MAKRRSTKSPRVTTTTRRPKAAALPGLEDHAIRPLEDVAGKYADIRDRRMELTQEESDLKKLAIKLMHKYDKTIYRHDGVTITLVPGDEDVKVKVKKPGDDDDTEAAAVGGAEFDAERRAAVASSD